MATISHKTETVSISENETGTPNEGVVVPQRPGPINITRCGGFGSSTCSSRPMSLATA